MKREISIIGAGLSGCEAALQLAEIGRASCRERV